MDGARSWQTPIEITSLGLLVALRTLMAEW